MTKADFRRLLEHKDAVVADRVRYEPALKEISKYVLPHRANWEWDDNSEVGRPEIYDSTAVKANQDLADGLQGYMVSPRAPWLKIRMEDVKEDADKELRAWIEDHAEPGLYRVFRRSNFYPAVGQSFQDQALGTVIMYVEPNDERIVNYKPLHLKAIYIAENSEGVIDTVFHKMKIPNRAIIEDYGTDGIPDAQLSEMKKNPFGRSLVWRAVYPNGKYKPDLPGHKGMLWTSITWLDGAMDRPLKESGYRKFPYIIWLPYKSTDEAYGRSSAWYALGDILRLNQLEKSMLKLSLLSVEPPLMVPAEALEEVNVTPWGINPYMDPNRRLFPLELGANYPFGEKEREQLRESIRGYFMVDAFRIMSQYADKEWSATQAAEIAGEKGAMATAQTSRVGSDFLDPLVEMTLVTAIEKGEIPPPPKRINGGLKVDYVGPLTMDQERAFKTSGPIRALNLMIPYLEANPAIWDMINDDGLFRRLLLASGLSERDFRSKDEVAKIRQARAEAAAAQQQADLNKAQAQAYKDSTWSPGAGSAAEKELQRVV